MPRARERALDGDRAVEQARGGGRPVDDEDGECRCDRRAHDQPDCEQAGDRRSCDCGRPPPPAGLAHRRPRDPRRRPSAQARKAACTARLSLLVTATGSSWSSRSMRSSPRGAPLVQLAAGACLLAAEADERVRAVVGIDERQRDPRDVRERSLPDGILDDDGDDVPARCERIRQPGRARGRQEVGEEEHQGARRHGPGRAGKKLERPVEAVGRAVGRAGDELLLDGAPLGPIAPRRHDCALCLRRPRQSRSAHSSPHRSRRSCGPPRAPPPACRATAASPGRATSRGSGRRPRRS